MLRVHLGVLPNLYDDQLQRGGDKPPVAVVVVNSCPRAERHFSPETFQPRGAIEEPEGLDEGLDRMRKKDRIRRVALE